MLKYIKKEFLAPEASSQDSSVVCTIHQPSDIGKYSRITADACIRDCHSSVNIGFGFGSEADYKKALAKLDVLIDNLQAFRKEVVKTEKEFRKAVIKAGTKLEDDE